MSNIKTEAPNTPLSGPEDNKFGKGTVGSIIGHLDIVNLDAVPDEYLPLPGSVGNMLFSRPSFLVILKDVIKSGRKTKKDLATMTITDIDKILSGKANGPEDTEGFRDFYVEGVDRLAAMPYDSQDALDTMNTHLLMGVISSARGEILTDLGLDESVRPDVYTILGLESPSQPEHT